MSCQWLHVMTAMQICLDGGDWYRDHCQFKTLLWRCLRLQVHTHARMHPLFSVGQSALRDRRQVETTFVMGKTCPSHLETPRGNEDEPFSLHSQSLAPAACPVFAWRGLLCSGSLSAKTETHALQNNTPRSSSFFGYEKLVQRKKFRLLSVLVFFGSFVHIAN